MSAFGFVDAALEATVVGGFSRIGYEVRSRLGGWDTDIDLSGKQILVTGGTSGIGLAAASMATAAGARVAITGRDERRLERAATEIARHGTAPVTVRADCADLDDVQSMFDEAVSELGGLDVLVNNAGALDHEFQRTAQGFEQTYAVHVLAPFLLTSLAIPLLTPDGTVITVSSGGMYSERLDPEHLEMSPDEYDGVVAYARAKRAQVALNEAWAQRMPDGPTFAAMHPGWADTPGVQTSLATFRRLTRPILRTPEQGADTIVWLAGTTVPTGRFWLDRHERSTVRLPWLAVDEQDVQLTFETVARDAGVRDLPLA